MLTVLGVDPGTVNCAFGIVKFGLDGKYEIVTHGMVAQPIKEVAGLDVGKRAALFEKEIRALKRKHNVDVCVAERFMTRGHKGTTIEAVSMMLGIMASIFKTEIAFITAAQWKNIWNKHNDLNEFYTSMKTYGIPAHRVDAVGIGLYGATLSLREEHFTMLRDIRKFKKKFIEAR